ncbi:type II toxin-antitoxin system RelE/ParE family toxin [Notoacmeibacter ruber]|uniref:Type II toxin-antitoxin system RelE/ParE family toxin n=1 Tax=Notoacmeibacter ruber TaxID=2670375 RepID=A0A3L7J3A8_9HYPH|nr:type II toxin-antitoxin system RelE/ParE family toxin [Notoacmeibacter ruber]RLQ84984.1 type II toxin-antitoxin system RelE/ParE family toxin [Notoacmeibacter ruber]
MFQIIQSSVFTKWLGGLKDRRAKQRIAARLVRLEDGNVGDAKSVGGGISELRIPYGPGYRVYFTRRGHMVVILLCGGDKSSQARDIQTARELAETWKGSSQ